MSVTRTVKSYPPSISEPAYFGCWERSGHFAHAPGGRRLRGYGEDRDEVEEWLASHDAVLPPPGCSGPEGIATFRRWPALQGDPESAVTCIAFWDRSVDSRPNSHSTFLLPGFLAFDEAVELARSAFPEVFERLAARGVEVRRCV